MNNNCQRLTDVGSEGDPPRLLCDIDVAPVKEAARALGNPATRTDAAAMARELKAGRLLLLHPASHPVS